MLALVADPPFVEFHDSAQHKFDPSPCLDSITRIRFSLHLLYIPHPPDFLYDHG